MMKLRFLTLVVVGVLSLAACNDDDNDTKIVAVNSPTQPTTPSVTPTQPNTQPTTPTVIETYYQTKTPYQAPKDIANLPAAPTGYVPVYTQLLARHGSRGLSSIKYDLVVYRMWQQAKADGALTELGEKLGDDVLAIMQANFFLGQNVDGVSFDAKKGGYGNETQVGINEHTELAKRLLSRLPTLWQDAAAHNRRISVMSSGQDRAVDSAYFFAKSLQTHAPMLANLVYYPPAPMTKTQQPDGVNRYQLYFHKLEDKLDGVEATSPLYPTFVESQNYQTYKKKDADLANTQAQLAADSRLNAAGRVVLEQLFSKTFVDKIADGTYQFANDGSMTFADANGKELTLSGDGKTKIDSLASGGQMLYELYSIAPAMMKETNGVDFLAYMPPAQAKIFAEYNDASDFYDKGPGFTDKNQITSKMAQYLQDDFFASLDNVVKGDTREAARLRFAHAEIVIPFATLLGVNGTTVTQPTSTLYNYSNNPWRGVNISPMAANVQWDLYKNGTAYAVRMLYNEKPTAFKPACDYAKLTTDSNFYDYTKLRQCYGYQSF